MLLHSNQENFNNAVINSHKLVLVDFFATWCGPCQMLAPVLEELSNSDNSFDIVKIDIDSNTDLAVQYDIEAVPTLVIFKNGKELDRTMGFIDKHELINFISKYKEQ